MVEVAIIGFMVSGAFLGFVYLDVIYQMIGTTVVLKMIFRREHLAHRMRAEQEQPAADDMEGVPALA
jgi:hypothetical protein